MTERSSDSHQRDESGDKEQAQSPAASPHRAPTSQPSSNTLRRFSPSPSPGSPSQNGSPAGSNAQSPTQGDDDKVMIFKLLMVGPHAVGKTTVVHYVSKGKFTNVLTTVGLEFASKSWTFDRHPILGRVTINAEITDIQGQDRGKASLNRFMARNTKAVICVTCHPVDNTKLEELEDWFLATQNALSGAIGYDDLKFYILINKCDLVDNTEKARGEELVRKWIAARKGKDSSGQKMDADKIVGFTSCSAKTGTNLPKAVTSFVEGVVKTCPESDFAQPLTSAPTYAPPISAIQKRDNQKKQCQC